MKISKARRTPFETTAFGINWRYLAVSIIVHLQRRGHQMRPVDREATARVIDIRQLNAINVNNRNQLPAHELIMMVPSMEPVNQVWIYLCTELKRKPLLIA
jgi:hypothetical protein